MGCGMRRGRLCPACAAGMPDAPAPGQAPGAGRVTAAAAYEGVARDLVLDLKLRGRRDAVGPLVDAMCRAVWRHGLAASTVTWVPGRPRDAAVRGFDHAELLARRVAARLGLDPSGLLTRTHATRDQTGLSRAQRFRNLAGAFTAYRPVPARVVLIDDVLTTGATAAACSRALRDAGASLVEVLVAVRTG